jgi:hypothetical protein
MARSKVKLKMHAIQYPGLIPLFLLQKKFAGARQTCNAIELNGRQSRLSVVCKSEAFSRSSCLLI